MPEDKLQPFDESDGPRLRAVLEQAVDGIITIDERGIINDANSAAERLFGYSLSEMVGQNVATLMPEPWASRHDGYLRAYLATGERKIIGIGREVAGRRKDGSTFPMYLSVSEVIVGTRRLFTGIVHDLGDLKSAERAASRLGQILDDSLNEIFVFDATSLQFELVNRGARENLGYSMDELRKMTPVDLKPDFTPERFARTVQPLRTGERSSLQFATRHQRKDGSTYPVEVSLQLSRLGEKPVFVAIILDVSEREQAAAERSRLADELQDRLQELRIRDQAIQAASEGIVIARTDEPGYPIVSANTAFELMTGLSSAEVLGHRLLGTLGADPAADAVATVVDDAIERGVECRVVLQYPRSDGSHFWNEVSLAPVHNAEGNVTHLVAVMEDITQRRLTEERLVQAERLAAIGEMVTGLAHESRNALQRAQACLDMLSLDLQEQPEQLDLTARARTAIDDLRRLYEEVRSYAAPISIEKRTCRLSDVWRKVWDDLAFERSGRTIELVDHVDDSEPEVRIDSHRMEQVFRNILENSISACQDPGRIEIRCAAAAHNAQPGVRLMITDNGPGIPPELQDRIFQPFFTTKQKGTGLGMAIAKRIVDAHDGTIEVYCSDDPGACICLSLPG